MKIAAGVGGAPAGRGQGQHLGFLLFGLGLGCVGHRGKVLPNKGLHRLGKRKALDFDKVVQGRPPADATGKPIPFSVADFQTVMLTGALGVATDADKLVGIIPLEIGQQIKLFGLGDLFRRNVAHYRPSRWPGGQS